MVVFTFELVFNGSPRFSLLGKPCPGKSPFFWKISGTFLSYLGNDLKLMLFKYNFSYKTDINYVRMISVPETIFFCLSFCFVGILFSIRYWVSIIKWTGTISIFAWHRFKIIFYYYVLCGPYRLSPINSHFFGMNIYNTFSTHFQPRLRIILNPIILDGEPCWWQTFTVLTSPLGKVHPIPINLFTMP